MGDNVDVDQTEEAFPVLDYSVPHNLRDQQRSEFSADVWWQLPGSEGEYSKQTFSLPYGASGEDLVQLLGRQSRLLVALSHFSWGYGALARASEDKEVAKALLQLATDERYRKVFYSVVTDKLGEWDSERELHWLSSEYFPFAQEAENDE